MLGHKAGQDERGEILLENSFRLCRCYQGKITSNNLSVLYVLKNIDITLMIQQHNLRYNFWLVDHPMLEQVSTLR